MLNDDFKDMLQCLIDAEVRFLLVGDYALAAHGFPRATKDMDLWIEPSAENTPQLLLALKDFGAPGHGVSSEEFSTPSIVLQLGQPFQVRQREPGQFGPRDDGDAAGFRVDVHQLPGGWLAKDKSGLG